MNSNLKESPILITNDWESKTKFNIEILLSDAQMKMLCEDNGDDEYEELDIYKEMSAENYIEPVTSDPSFDCGLGADINDILSLGFMFYNFINENHKTRLSLDDLNLHPFRIRIAKIKTIDYDFIPCEITGTPFSPITMAIGNDGDVIL